MKSVHLVIPDLFLPQDVAVEVCRGLRLPTLEKLLGRGVSTGSGPATSSGRTDVLGLPLENLLYELFGVPCEGDAPIAPISAAFDGLGAGCWLRADPVHLHLHRDQTLLAGVLPSREEAAAMCASLNAHFAGQGMEFFAPHPQRWYVRLDALPRISASPSSQVIGCNVRGILPTGVDASRWHRALNEIQMLLFSHPLNEAREARGEMAINSVWLWGGGCNPMTPLEKRYDGVSSDDVLSAMFAAAADVPFASWNKQWNGAEGRQLLVFTGLRLALQRNDFGAWREALQDFENSYAQPLWRALRSGKIARLQIDIPGGGNLRRVQLACADSWAFWRRTSGLANYSIV